MQCINAFTKVYYSSFGNVYCHHCCRSMWTQRFTHTTIKQRNTLCNTGFRKYVYAQRNCFMTKTLYAPTNRMCNVFLNNSRNYSTSECLPNTETITSNIDQSTKLRELLHMRYVYVRTCDHEWADIPLGMTFDVCYMDSMPHAQYDAKRPVVLGVHNAPGTHDDLVDLLAPLAMRGVRVLIPTFPGFGNTHGKSRGDQDAYDHGVEHKANFLIDFLEVLGIPRVDVTVGVGYGTIPTLYLCQTDTTRAALAISPIPHIPLQSQGSVMACVHFANRWDIVFLRWLLRLFVHFLCKDPALKGASRHDKVEFVRNVAAVCSYSEMVSLLSTIHLKRFPISVVYSGKDERVKQSELQSYLSQMMITASNTSIVHSQEHAEETNARDTFPRAIYLQNGGHNSQYEYPKLLTAEIIRILRHVRPELIR